MSAGHRPSLGARPHDRDRDFVLLAGSFGVCLGRVVAGGALAPVTLLVGGSATIHIAAEMRSAIIAKYEDILPRRKKE